MTTTGTTRGTTRGTARGTTGGTTRAAAGATNEGAPEPDASASDIVDAAAGGSVGAVPVPTMGLEDARKPVPERWLVLVYKVPSEPSRARVSVWRELRRLGAQYLQQAVCVLPHTPDVTESLRRVRERIQGFGGQSTLGVLTLDADDHQKVALGFLNHSQRDYQEIVEECETKFFAEIRFERARENFTFEEAEEIRQDLEKLRRWFIEVQSRDWLGAPGVERAARLIEECAEQLELFDADVFQRERGADGA